MTFWEKIVAFFERTIAHRVYAPFMPDPVLTPGATNPDVTQDNIAQTIGKRGWTATVRPSKAYTEALKAAQMRARKLPGKLGDYEEDHLIPLELGGNPTSPLNLWPEPWKPIGGHGAAEKDLVENALRVLVVSGKMPLVEAQQRIALNWRTAVP